MITEKGLERVREGGRGESEREMGRSKEWDMPEESGHVQINRRPDDAEPLTEERST